MSVNEPVRGSIPPPWFWALSGLERIQALSNGLVQAPPLFRLTGIRPAHVGPGGSTWTMPANDQLQGLRAELEISILTSTALHGTAMTAAPPGTTIHPLTVHAHNFRPVRPRTGNLVARGRVVNTSRFFTFTEVLLEDAQGRQIGAGSSHAEIRQVDPLPPPPPEQLRPVEEPTYSTVDPYARPAARAAPTRDMWIGQGGEKILRAVSDGSLRIPYFEMLGMQMEENGDQIVVTAPAASWLCLFTRSVSAVGVTGILTGTSWVGALKYVEPDESLVGLMQSTNFYRTAWADGRPLRITVRGVRHLRHLVVEELCVDADGTLIAAQQATATVVKQSQRQASSADNAKRELCTLLFTDIVGSTEHLERLGDARWRTLLSEHREIVRREIVRAMGTEIDTAGDGFFVRFDAPAHALQCARAVREAVRHLGIEIRAGIHTGECEVQGRSVSGLAVHAASRIEAAASAGEVLVSNTVKDLVMGSDLTFTDRGEHTLKGVPGEWHLYALAD